MASSEGSFPTTQWTLINIVRDGDEASRRRALESLCKVYWMPLYAVARGSGLDPHGAEDAVQGFFYRALKDELLLRADEGAGRLRSLLCVVLKRYICHEQREAKALKRGGGAKHVPWLPGDAEERYRLLVASDDSSPDEIFQREWARSIIVTAQENLKRSYEIDGKSHLFACLADSLPWSGCAEGDLERGAGERAGLTQKEFCVALHRMRKRLRVCIRNVVRETLQTTDSAVIDAEIMDLLALLAP